MTLQSEAASVSGAAWFTYEPAHRAIEPGETISVTTELPPQTRWFLTTLP